MIRRGGFVVLILIFLVSCNKSTSSSEENKPKLSPLAEQGIKVYRTRCIMCHNANPAVPGGMGPEIQGASLELLTAKILKQSYPEGYTAKRPTRAMPAMPFLEKDIPALHAYLNNL